MSTRLTVLVATVALAAVATATAGAAVVQLRVDSASAPGALFDGPVSTLPHTVDGGDGSGPHPCTGPPDGTPDATATGALDDAMRGAGVSWRGNWDPSFRDFFIDRIGPWASAEPDLYWSISVNGRVSPGGCLARVEDGDSIHFHYGPLFGMPPPGGAADGANPDGGGKGQPAGGASSAQLKRVAARAAHFLRRSREESGGWERLALALRRDSGPDAAAAALLGDRLRKLRPNGSLAGDVNATAVAVLALRERRPRAAQRAAGWLASVQRSDGGFGFRPEAPADVDTTGLVTWALMSVASAQAATTRPPPADAARRAADFLASAQAAGGGFPAVPGGIANAQSTGLALAALRAAGLGPRVAHQASGRTGLDFLLALARDDGAIAYATGASPTPAWTTAQALLGLTGRAKLLNPSGGSR